MSFGVWSGASCVQPFPYSIQIHPCHSILRPSEFTIESQSSSVQWWVTGDDDDDDFRGAVRMTRGQDELNKTRTRVWVALVDWIQISHSMPCSTRTQNKSELIANKGWNRTHTISLRRAGALKEAHNNGQKKGAMVYVCLSSGQKPAYVCQDPGRTVHNNKIRSSLHEILCTRDELTEPELPTCGPTTGIMEFTLRWANGQ